MRGKARKSVMETEQENREKMRKRGWEASGEVWMWAAAFRGGGGSGSSDACTWTAPCLQMYKS